MTATTLHEQLRERAGLGALPDAPPEPEASEDRPQSDDDRYAIYSVQTQPRSNARRTRLAETSRDGIGLTLCTLREEGQITNDSRIGILDRQERTWIVNPWARGA